MEEETMYEDIDSFEKFFDSFVWQVNDDSNVLVPYAGEHLMSMEALSLNFAGCIIDDINMIMELKKQKCNQRYADGIIRGICEQVIEFIYLHKNPDKLSEYYSVKTDEGYEVSEKEIKDDDDLCGLLRKIIGDKRYINGRSIRKMADDIDEVRGEGLSLYEVYQVISTLYHNSYFEHMLRLVGEAGKIEKADEADVMDDDMVEDGDIDALMLTVILTKFWEEYDEIVDPLRNYK